MCRKKNIISENEPKKRGLGPLRAKRSGAQGSPFSFWQVGNGINSKAAAGRSGRSPTVLVCPVLTRFRSGFSFPVQQFYVGQSENLEQIQGIKNSRENIYKREGGHADVLSKIVFF